MENPAIATLDSILPARIDPDIIPLSGNVQKELAKMVLGSPHIEQFLRGAISAMGVTGDLEFGVKFTCKRRKEPAGG